MRGRQDQGGAGGGEDSNNNSNGLTVGLLSSGSGSVSGNSSNNKDDFASLSGSSMRGFRAMGGRRRSSEVRNNPAASDLATSARKAHLTLHHHRIDELWDAYFSSCKKRPLPRLTSRQKTDLILQYEKAGRSRLPDMYRFLEGKLGAEIARRGGANKVQGIDGSKCPKCGVVVGFEPELQMRHAQLHHDHNMWCSYVLNVASRLKSGGKLFKDSWCDFVQRQRSRGRTAALVALTARRKLPREVARIIFEYLGGSGIVSRRPAYSLFCKNEKDIVSMVRRHGAFAALQSQYQTEPLQRSLLDPGVVLNSSKSNFVAIDMGSNAFVQDMAVKQFALICKYMTTPFERANGVWPKTAHASSALTIIKSGQKMPRIADEIYMQLLKQLFRCSGGVSVEERGWHLLCLCSEYLPPFSPSIERKVRSFLERAAHGSGAVATPESFRGGDEYYGRYRVLPNSRGEHIFDLPLRIRIYASYALHHLEKTLPSMRRRLSDAATAASDRTPTETKIGAYLRGKMPFMCKVDMPACGSLPGADREHIIVACDVECTVGDLAKDSCNHFDVSTMFTSGQMAFDLVCFGGTYTMLPASSVHEMSEKRVIIGGMVSGSDNSEIASDAFLRSSVWEMDVTRIRADPRNGTPYVMTGLRMCLVPRVVWPTMFDVSCRSMLHFRIFRDICNGWYSSSDDRRGSGDDSAMQKFTHERYSKEKTRFAKFAACTSIMSALKIVAPSAESVPENLMQLLFDKIHKSSLVPNVLSKLEGAKGNFSYGDSLLKTIRAECVSMLSQIPSDAFNQMNVASAVELRPVCLFARQTLIGAIPFAARPIATSWNASLSVNLSLHDDTQSNHYEMYTGWVLSINIAGVHLIHLKNPSKPVATIPLCDIYQWGMSGSGMVVLKLTPEDVATNEEIPEGEQVSFEMNPQDASSFCALLMEHIEVIMSAVRVSNGLNAETTAIGKHNSYNKWLKKVSSLISADDDLDDDDDGEGGSSGDPDDDDEDDHAGSAS